MNLEAMKKATKAQLPEQATRTMPFTKMKLKPPLKMKK